MTMPDVPALTPEVCPVHPACGCAPASPDPCTCPPLTPGLRERIEEAARRPLVEALLAVRDGSPCWCDHGEAVGEHAWWCRQARAALGDRS